MRPNGPLSEKRGYKKRNRPGGFSEAVGVVPGDSVGILIYIDNQLGINLHTLFTHSFSQKV